MISIIDDASNPNEIEIKWTDECTKKNSGCDDKIITDYYTVTHKADSDAAESKSEKICLDEKQDVIFYKIADLIANTKYTITVTITSHETSILKVHSDPSSVEARTGK